MRVCSINRKFNSNLIQFHILVSGTLKDSPNQDAYGRFAKDAKITALRTYANFECFSVEL